MRPRSWILVAVAALTGSLPTAVRADEGSVCVDAYEKSQMLMRPASGQSTLLPAREMLHTCMRSGCKEWMLADWAVPFTMEGWVAENGSRAYQGRLVRGSEVVIASDQSENFSEVTAGK